MKQTLFILLFFGASCVSTRKYYRNAQKITDRTQAIIDSIYAQKCPCDTTQKQKP